MFNNRKVFLTIFVSWIFGINTIMSVQAYAKEQYTKEQIIQNARTMKPSNPRYNCFYLKTVKLEEAGFITLHFKHNIKITSKYIDYHKTYCPENVLYDVKVYDDSFKASKIIGAKGVNGRQTNKDFWIQVAPNTNSISLSILKSKEVQSETWYFGKLVKQLKKKNCKTRKS